MQNSLAPVAAVSFAAWGLISAFAGRFQQRLHLSATETAFLVAVPVLLGALARLPMGVLADQFGGRVVMSLLMAAVAVPVYLVPAATDYRTLLVAAFFLGLAGSSFAVGVGYGLERLAMLRYGIDDIRKVEAARVA